MSNGEWVTLLKILLVMKLRINLPKTTFIQKKSVKTAGQSFFAAVAAMRIAGNMRAALRSRIISLVSLRKNAWSAP